MSFSYDVKKELKTIEDTPRHCRTAELSAFVLFLLDAEEEGIVLSASNELPLTVAASLFKKLFRAETEIVKARKKYSLVLKEDETCREVRRALKMSQDVRTFPDTKQLLSKNCCNRAFLRGAFLCAGTISDPDRSYHLEINCRNEFQARAVDEAIRALQIEPGIIRRNRYISVYIKDGDAVSDLLGLIGARVSLLELENRRIVRFMRGNVNRQVNCETANIEKAAAASARQIEDIRTIYENGGGDLLTGGLEELAGLRMAHPEATLLELSEMMDPPIGKSGINHRFRKISRIAESLRKDGSSF